MTALLEVEQKRYNAGPPKIQIEQPLAVGSWQLAHRVSTAPGQMPMPSYSSVLGRITYGILESGVWTRRISICTSI